MKNENQETICQWADETFGETSPAAACGRMFDEVIELESGYFKEDYSKMAEELIDVVITGMRFLSKVGVDFQAALDEKMRVNRARRWQVTSDGVGQHVDETE